jgi:uncharacterized protein YkwD
VQEFAHGRAWRSRAAVTALAVTAALTLQVQQPVEADAVSLTTLRNRIDSLTDAARKKAGCKPLTINAKLTTAAQKHATDMSVKRYFSHTSKNGTTWNKRITKAGYSKPGGENIARGFPTASEVVKAWMKSPGHKRNILDCKFKNIGIGYAPVGHYWVQDFGY